MSVYNEEKFLKAAIDSILNQTFSDFEFIIINDASSDTSRDIITSYNDPRIVFIENKENIGLTKSLNIGIKIAKGKYIARMDADDISLPERLQSQYDFMENNQRIDICGTNYRVLDTEEEKILPTDDDDIKIKLFSGINPIAHPTVMVRGKSLTEKRLFYNEKIKYAQDFEFWTRALPFFNFSNLSTTLLLYRKHSNQITNRKTEDQQNIVANSLLNLLKLLGISASEKEQNLHLSLLQTTFLSSKEEIEASIEWVDVLKKKNMEKNFFSPESFNKELNTKLKYLIKNFLISNRYKGKALLYRKLLKKIGIKAALKLLIYAK